MDKRIVLLILNFAWLLGLAAFHVALDQAAVLALPRQHTLLDVPSATCKEQTAAGDAAAVEHWHPHCVHGLTKHVECEYNGFQYSMEYYFMQVARDNTNYPAGAQYIYFPQCVSQVYFALRSSYNMTHWAAIEAAEVEYLVPLLRWAHGTKEHALHGGRNFWTVFSMDLGRQDFTRSAAWLEHWSVGSLTGSERWLQATNAFHIGLSELAADRSDSQEAGDGDCWLEDTAPVALANMEFPARNFRDYDTVISIPSRFTPNERSKAYDGRPTLAFFAGSPNSCARRHVLKLYGNVSGFDVSTEIKGDDDYRERMWSSRFCLVFRGSSHTNNVRVYDVIAHGCIPVVISDDFQPPLDQWLPWQDIAVFLPTAAIPRLEHVLKQIPEERRRQLFAFVASGSSEEGPRKAQLLAGTRLDEETLWSGLSAARVFDWDASAFWILFFADVVCKLSKRVAEHNARGGGPVVDSDLFANRICVHAQTSMKKATPDLEIVNMKANAASKVVSFRWQRRDWWTEALKAGNDDLKVTAISELLASLHWLHDVAWRRHGQLPGAVVDCGPTSAQDTAWWLNALGAKDNGSVHTRQEPNVTACRQASDASSGSRTSSGCALVEFAAPSVAAVGLEPSALKLKGFCGGCSPGLTGFRTIHARLGASADNSAALTLASAWEHAVASVSPTAVLPAVFLLRAGPRCWWAVLRTLRDTSETIPIKFLIFSLQGVGGRASATLEGRLATIGGWLCFVVAGAAGIRPIFKPFAEGSGDGASAGAGSGVLGMAAALFCGREDDSDLDAIVRPLPSSSTSASRPPERWGAGGVGPATLGRNDVIRSPAWTRGRFLYSAA